VVVEVVVEGVCVFRLGLAVGALVDAAARSVAILEAEVVVVVAAAVLLVVAVVVELALDLGVVADPPDGVVLAGRSHSGCKGKVSC
jgi:hypothetical protein